MAVCVYQLKGDRMPYQGAPFETIIDGIPYLIGIHKKIKDG
jgi:hypothetical protein